MVRWHNFKLVLPQLPLAADALGAKDLKAVQKDGCAETQRLRLDLCVQLGVDRPKSRSGMESPTTAIP